MDYSWLTNFLTKAVSVTANNNYKINILVTYQLHLLMLSLLLVDLILVSSSYLNKKAEINFVEIINKLFIKYLILITLTIMSGV